MAFSSIKSALIDYRVEKIDSDYDEETWSYLAEVLKGDDIDFDEKHDWLCGMFPLLNDMNSKEIVKCLINISKGISMKSPENCAIFSNPKLINDQSQNDQIVPDEIIDLNDGSCYDEEDNDDDCDDYDNEHHHNYEFCSRGNSMRNNSNKTHNEKILDDYIFKFQDYLSEFDVDRSTLDDIIIQYILELIVDIERTDEVALIIQPYFPNVSEVLITELSEHFINLSKKYNEEKLNCINSLIAASIPDGFETQGIECGNSLSSLENVDDHETSKGGLNLLEEILSEYPAQALEDFQLLGSMLPDVPKDVLLFVYLIEHQRDKYNTIQFFLDVNETDRGRIYDDFKNRFKLFIERFIRKI